MEHGGHIQGQGAMFSTPALSSPSQAFSLAPPRQQKQPQLGAAGRLFLDVWGGRGGHLARFCSVSQFKHGPFNKKI